MTRIIVIVFGVAALTGCGTDRAPSTALTVASTHPAAATQPAADAAANGAFIDSILYSDLPKDKMLERLKPLVALGDSKDDFTTKTGLRFGDWFGSGPGVVDYSVDGCGLNLVVDPDEKIRVIRRHGKSVDGKDYPEMSISEPWFEWTGYQRWYPE